MTGPMRRRWSLLAAAFVVAIAAGVYHAAPGHAQTLPPNLVGEQFLAFDQAGGGLGLVDVTGECTAVAGGQWGPLSYSASGIATGPYPGPFTETGTVTGSLTTGTVFASGDVVTWTANFTIDSPTGDVTGSKTLTLSTQAFCGDTGSPGAQQISATATLTYEATIVTAAGTFRDSGQAFAAAHRFDCTAFCAPLGRQEVFVENFLVSNGVLPVDTSGKATGGGQIVSATDPRDRVTFGFNVRKSQDGSRLQGTCNVLDHTTGTYVKCLTVTSYQQIGNTAIWEGSAKVNGTTEHYRITVQDNGEPNRGLDTFVIDTASYDAGGPVTHGNVHVHRQS